MAHLPGAEPPWGPSGLSHGAGRGGQAADVGQAALAAPGTAQAGASQELAGGV